MITPPIYQLVDRVAKELEHVDNPWETIYQLRRLINNYKRERPAPIIRMTQTRTDLQEPGSVAYIA